MEHIAHQNEDFRTNVGDTVRLKSGGPLMTVNEIAADGRVLCTWHNGTKYEYAGFEAAILELED
jgi:uncharacterized protein YodC (DUF2158 family)